MRESLFELKIKGSCNALKDSKILKLPYRSRNLKRLIKVLAPQVLDINNERFFLWLIEFMGNRFCCVVKGTFYSISLTDTYSKDLLSDLRVKVSIPKGLVDNRIVWKAKWSGSGYVIDELDCDLKLKI